LIVGAAFPDDVWPDGQGSRGVFRPSVTLTKNESWHPIDWCCKKIHQPTRDPIRFKKISALYYLPEAGPELASFTLINPNLEVVPMSVYCPSCGSHHVITRNVGRKVGGTTGVAAGTASGAAGALGGAKAGAVIGAFAGPVGIGLGSLAGAVFGGLAGGAAGGVAGAKLGEELDTKVLDNYECRGCGHTFRPHVE